MPETTIDENGKSEEREHEIRIARDRQPASPSSDTARPEQVRKTEFGRSIIDRPHGGHYQGTLFWCYAVQMRLLLEVFRDLDEQRLIGLNLVNTAVVLLEQARHALLQFVFRERRKFLDVMPDERLD